MRQLPGQLHSLPAFNSRLYEDLKKTQKRPQLDDLSPVLTKICQVSQPNFVVIDALNECTLGQSCQAILDAIKQLEKASVRLFLTTHCIKQKLGSFSQIKIEANSSDIATLITEMIKKDDDAMGIIDDDLKPEIVTELCRNSQGMYACFS